MTAKDGEKKPHETTRNRRDFLKTATVLSTFLVLGGTAAVIRSIFPKVNTQAAKAAFPKVKVANIGDLRVNQPVTFNYPLENEPNILVKSGQISEGGIGPDGDIVAFSQICQHLGCIYAYQAPGTSPQCNPSYKASGPLGYCCCHGGIFDFLHRGKVLGGPPPRPMPQVVLELDSASGDIYAVGMSPPTIYGHHTGSDDVSYDLQE